ncbi:TraB/GumN family protein [Chitinophaga sancti]|uniref:TraB/GumN family protein n=1 Tax=Chitinophaga sancti TaxID=1004 RepID=UPI002A74F14D|nr:TraB/GumN family protein [Chitinophaga sancti]WPQ66133.1 TraB/GumN family protein [Chitinophaga sancti]
MFTTLLCLLTTFLPAAHKDSSSLLWKISGHGLSKPSYLFGTIHMLCTDDLPFSVAIGKAMKETKAFYMEFNMDDTEAMTRIAGEMMMPEGYSFKALLSPEDYTILSDYFRDSVGTSLQLLDKMKPMLIMSMLLEKTATCPNPVSCENMLLLLAKDQGLTIHGLENAEDQIAIFDSIPDKEEAASLVKQVKDMAASRTEYQQLLDAYYKADLNQLLGLILQEEDVVRYKKLMLDDRNNNWIPVITKQIQQTPSFFAFGAGHLAGKGGVIALLRKAGYKVEPVAL